MSEPSRTRPVDPERQRKALEDAERHAHETHPRNFQDEALTDKRVRIEPDGIGPTSTGTMDTESDQRSGSGDRAPERPSKQGGEDR